MNVNTKQMAQVNLKDTKNQNMKELNIHVINVNTEFLKDEKCPGSSFCDAKNVRIFSTEICPFMAICNETLRNQHKPR
jgi:hypothetical protein